MRTVEQICKRHLHHGRGHVRWLKRQSVKLMRRLSRTLGEDAPRRLPIRGYSD